MASTMTSLAHIKPSAYVSRAPSTRLAATSPSGVISSRPLGSRTSFLSQKSQFMGLKSAQSSPLSFSSRRNSLVCASWRGDGPSSVKDRVVAALPYLLPLFDGLRYGKFLFIQFPAFAAVLSPFEPLINIYFSVPFASLAAFFAVYLGIINSPNFGRYVRFNAMQAVLLDIILILPGLLESVFKFRPMGGPGLQLYISGYNTIFIFIFACVAYGVGSCLAGTNARLPIVADAADAQIR
ncbi:hypothetical protein Ndes2526B_g00058 [Nannochloris sp. 'desiccata']